jgi:hypothetical protein
MQIRRIAERFRWSRFAPIVVAPLEGGLYAVVDGQHRCHAARLRNIKSVPCIVSLIDTAEQAEAFAEINTRQLAVQPAVLHKSRVAAGDPDAVALENLITDAGVRVVTPRPQKDLKRGDTFAVATLYQARESYERKTLRQALRAIVGVGDGNIGLVRQGVILAYCAAFEDDKPRRDHPDLLDALDEFDLQAAFHRMQSGAVAGKRRWLTLTEELARYLRRKLPMDGGK